jgi:hypothetical protein
VALRDLVAHAQETKSMRKHLMPVIVSGTILALLVSSLMDGCLYMKMKMVMMTLRLNVYSKEWTIVVFLTLTIIAEEVLTIVENCLTMIGFLSADTLAHMTNRPFEMMDQADAMVS